jgi:multiple sugar transport system permease protein
MAHTVEVSVAGVQASTKKRGELSAGRRRTSSWNLVAIGVGILFLLPFAWLVLTAFERYGGLDLSTGGGLTFSNFTQLFRNTTESQAVGEGVGRALLDSVYLSAGTMIVTTVVALVAAYPLSRFNLPGRDPIIYGIVFVTGLPIIAVVIPTYDIFVTYNLINSMVWTILFMTATSLPFAVWIGKNFIDAVPIELEEAASTEGAGIFKTLRYVTIPLITPGATVIAFYTFIQAWGNFFVPFILLTTPKLPAAVTTYQFFGQYTTNYSGLAAFSLVFTAVPVAFYVVVSRWGGGESLFSGAIKG